MSKSLIDAIRQTITEGARDKTSDGMTKDAKHFAQELHKVSDAGFKHMVQKDDETSDYAKMFNGDVDKAPTRPADYEPGQDLDKYVEYNEQLEIEEAKKKRGCSEDCECEDCASNDKEDMKEAMLPGIVARDMVSRPAPKNVKDTSTNVRTSPGPQSYVASRNTSSQPNFIQRGLNIGQSTSRVAPSGMSGSYDSSNQAGMGKATKAAGGMAVKRQASAPPPKAKATPVSPAAREPRAAAVSPAAREPSSPKAKATPVSPAAREPRAAAVSPAAREPSSPAPKVKAAPVSPASGRQKAKPGAQTVKPKVDKPQAPKQTPAQRAQQRRQAEKNAVGPEYRKAMNSSFEIDVNGTSYLVSEAHASAITAFVEKYGEVNEVLTKSTTAGETVSDFVHSKNPKFKGKSKNKRIQMALASYYDRQRK